MRYAALAFAVTVSAFAADPQMLLLWPNGAPGSEGKSGEEVVRIANNEHVTSNIHKPYISVYLPAKGTETGAAVVIAPGGGHSELWSDHEGHNVAKWLSERGVAGIVVMYRLARQKESTYTIDGHAFPDMVRALRMVRSRAAEWDIDPARVGVMGFSAGGELAALAGSRYDEGNPTAADAVDRLSSKPAFQALIYPAIPKDMKLSAETPPAFLLCGENDRQNISQGLPELYLAMKKAKASAELHVLAGVGHGFGMRATRGPSWGPRFYDWMDGRGWLKRK